MLYSSKPKYTYNLILLHLTQIIDIHTCDEIKKTKAFVSNDGAPFGTEHRIYDIMHIVYFHVFNDASPINL